MCNQTTPEPDGGFQFWNLTIGAVAEIRILSLIPEWHWEREEVPHEVAMKISILMGARLIQI